MKKLFHTIFLFLLCYSAIAQPKIKAVYFAQTHVVKLSYIIPGANEKLKLISERETLVKVNMTSPTAQASPVVQLGLTFAGQAKVIEMTGPPTLPTSFNDAFGQVNHKFDDSFTAVIPKEWVRPGLIVKIITPNEMWNFSNISMSAPNRIVMTNFEINAFALQNSPFTAGWEKEFGSKLPTAEFKVQNVPNILLPTIVSPPTGTFKAIKFSSLNDYNSQTGLTFGIHNITSKEWKNALSQAAGLNYNELNYISVSWTMTDRAIKGEGGTNFSSVQRRGGNGGLGTLLHEVGHALSLPHWGDDPKYPYKGNMFGINQGPIYKGTHAGPIWAYDDVKKYFIKPTRTSTAPLVYKNDPMQGGGEGSPESGFLVNHFSDYSVNKMRVFLENHLTVYNTFLGKYCTWNQIDKRYNVVKTNTGNVTYPVERDVNVISVMAAVSSKTAEANMVYPPIGPYKSGIIALFDPQVAADRTNADTYFCPTNGCDVTLKVLQGTTTRYMMLPINLESSLLATDPASFFTKAVNLKAADGEVLRVDILQTPDAEINGLPSNPAVLASWIKPGTASNASDRFLNAKNANSPTSSFSIYPNPSYDRINVSSNEIIENILIYNLSGQEVLSKNVNLKEISLDISHLQSGIYIAKLNANNNSELVRIVKN